MEPEKLPGFNVARARGMREIFEKIEPSLIDWHVVYGAITPLCGSFGNLRIIHSLRTDCVQTC
jgi:hypothetical protein